MGGDAKPEPADYEVEQVARIQEKLKQVRKQGIACHGSSEHRFSLHWRLSEWSIRRFEAKHGVELPRAYRTFLRLIGNGGAGPHFGISRLQDSSSFHDYVAKENPPDVLSRPCPLHPRMTRESNWRAQFPDFANPCQGILTIGGQGCTYVTGLIVSGREAGRVVNLDASAGDDAPYVLRDADFLCWHERWLDELLEGYDLFSWGIGGGEEELLRLINDPNETESERVEATQSLYRLPRISQAGRKRLLKLLRDPVPEVRAAACGVATKFRIAEALPLVRSLLQDQFTVVREAAVFLAMKLGPVELASEVEKLLSDPAPDVAVRAIYELTRNARLDYVKSLELVQNSPVSKVRLVAAGQLEHSPSNVEHFQRMLGDEAAEVRASAVRTLRMLPSESAIEGVHALLSKETDAEVIDEIIQFLGEVKNERNAQALLQWIDSKDELHQVEAVSSLCKLGDDRVESAARRLLRNHQPAFRSHEWGAKTLSGRVSELVARSLRESPNPKLRSIVPVWRLWLIKWWSWMWP